MQKIISISNRLFQNEMTSRPVASLSTQVAQAVARVVQTSSPHQLQGALAALFRQHGLAFDDTVLRQFLHHLQPQSVTSLFEKEFLQKAQNKTEFHKFMTSVFGEHADQKLAESLRQRALHGDFSWLPHVKFVDDATLQHANGAYDAKSKTVLLNKSKLSNKNLLQQTFVEEVGHHLDAKLNVRDTRGDEGEMFRRRLGGEVLSPVQIQAIRAENDHGVLNVNGKKVAVEFFANPFKAVTKAVKVAVGVVKKAVTTVAGAFGKLATGLVKTATKLTAGVGKAIYGGLKIAARSIGKTTRTILRAPMALGKAVGKKVWSVLTYPYRKIKNIALKFAEAYAWLEVRIQIRDQLQEIPNEDKTDLVFAIQDAMKSELAGQGKSILKMNPDQITALAKQKAKDILNPYIQAKVHTDVLNSMPANFDAAQKEALASEVESRLLQYLTEHNTSWLDLAQSHKLEARVTAVTTAVLQEAIVKSISTQVTQALAGVVPTALQSAYCDEILKRILASTGGQFTTLSQDDLKNIVRETTQEVVKTWMPNATA